jgi:hypothetical protein
MSKHIVYRATKQHALDERIVSGWYGNSVSTLFHPTFTAAVLPSLASAPKGAGTALRRRKLEAELSRLREMVSGGSSGCCAGARAGLRCLEGFAEGKSPELRFTEDLLEQLI